MIARGEIYWARFDPRSGAEQRGVRPAVVVSSDGFNLNPRWNSLVAVPCTTSPAQAARSATVVPLPKGLVGLNDDGYAICHQITTLDRSKFGKRIGALDTNTITAIEEGIRAALDMG